MSKDELIALVIVTTFIGCSAFLMITKGISEILSW